MRQGKSKRQEPLWAHQEFMLEKARFQNVIVFLPTNTGKTKIACRLIEEFAFADEAILKAKSTDSFLRKSENRRASVLKSKLIIFLAPKVPLVQQQADALRKEADIKICVRTGQISYVDPEDLEWDEKDYDDPKTWKAIREELQQMAKIEEEDSQKEKTKENEAEKKGEDEDEEEDEIVVPCQGPPRVFFMVPEVLLQYMEHGFIRMKDISLLVFDECHHVKSEKDLYHIIMLQHYRACPVDERPRILGLSAVGIPLNWTEYEKAAKQVSTRSLIRDKIEMIETSYTARLVPPPTKWHGTPEVPLVCFEVNKGCADLDPEEEDDHGLCLPMSHQVKGPDQEALEDIRDTIAHLTKPGCREVHFEEFLIKQARAIERVMELESTRETEEAKAGENEAVGGKKREKEKQRAVSIREMSPWISRALSDLMRFFPLSCFDKERDDIDLRWKEKFKKAEEVLDEMGVWGLYHFFGEMVGHANEERVRQIWAEGEEEDDHEGSTGGAAAGAEEKGEAEAAGGASEDEDSDAGSEVKDEDDKEDLEEEIEQDVREAAAIGSKGKNGLAGVVASSRKSERTYGGREGQKFLRTLRAEELEEGLRLASPRDRVVWVNDRLDLVTVALVRLRIPDLEHRITEAMKCLADMGDVCVSDVSKKSVAWKAVSDKLMVLRSVLLEELHFIVGGGTGGKREGVLPKTGLTAPADFAVGADVKVSPEAAALNLTRTDMLRMYWSLSVENKKLDRFDSEGARKDEELAVKMAIPRSAAHSVRLPNGAPDLYCPRCLEFLGRLPRETGPAEEMKERETAMHDKGGGCNADVRAVHFRSLLRRMRKAYKKMSDEHPQLLHEATKIACPPLPPPPNPEDVAKQVRNVERRQEADLKCIIFVNTRYKARLLARFLGALRLCRVGWVTSAAPAAGAICSASTGHRMKVREQKRTLDRFRIAAPLHPDNLQCLTATTVIEEGIDIPSCNLVLCFDMPSSPVENIQRRGRARRNGARYLWMKPRGQCGATVTQRNQSLKEAEDDLYLLTQGGRGFGKNKAGLEEEGICRGALHVKSSGALVPLDRAKVCLERAVGRAGKELWSGWWECVEDAVVRLPYLPTKMEALDRDPNLTKGEKEAMEKDEDRKKQREKEVDKQKELDDEAGVSVSSEGLLEIRWDGQPNPLGGGLEGVEEMWGAEKVPDFSQRSDQKAKVVSRRVLQALVECRRLSEHLLPHTPPPSIPKRMRMKAGVDEQEKTLWREMPDCLLEPDTFSRLSQRNPTSKAGSVRMYLHHVFVYPKQADSDVYKMGGHFGWWLHLFKQQVEEPSALSAPGVSSSAEMGADSEFLPQRNRKGTKFSKSPAKDARKKRRYATVDTCMWGDRQPKSCPPDTFEYNEKAVMMSVALLLPQPLRAPVNFPAFHPPHCNDPLGGEPLRVEIVVARRSRERERGTGKQKEEEDDPVHFDIDWRKMEILRRLKGKWLNLVHIDAFQPTENPVLLNPLALVTAEDAADPLRLQNPCFFPVALTEDPFELDWTFAEGLWEVRCFGSDPRKGKVPTWLHLIDRFPEEVRELPSLPPDWEERVKALDESSFSAGCPQPETRIATMVKHLSTRGPEPWVMRERDRPWLYWATTRVEHGVDPFSYGTEVGTIADYYEKFRRPSAQVSRTNTMVLSGDKIKQGSKNILFPPVASVLAGKKERTIDDVHYQAPKNLPQFVIPIPITGPMWHSLCWLPAIVSQLERFAKIQDLHVWLKQLCNDGPLRTPRALIGCEGGGGGLEDFLNKIRVEHPHHPICTKLKEVMERVGEETMENRNAKLISDTPADPDQFPLLAQRASTLLACGPKVQIEFDLLQEAMTSPAMDTLNLGHPEAGINYQRLEWLGDSVLKFLASLAVFFDCDNADRGPRVVARDDEAIVAAEIPDDEELHMRIASLIALRETDEGQLSYRRQRMISNAFLEKHSKRHRLYSFLVSRPFTHRTRGGQLLTEQRAQRVGWKPHADLVEALIGAVFLSNFRPDLLLLREKQRRVHAHPFTPPEELREIVVGKRQRRDRLMGLPGGLENCLDEDGDSVDREGEREETETGAIEKGKTAFLPLRHKADFFLCASVASAAFCDSFCLTNFLPPLLDRFWWAKWGAAEEGGLALPSDKWASLSIPGGFMTTDEVEKMWGYTFKNKKLVTVARSHRSLRTENLGRTATYERLEFLGDAVLEPLMRYFLFVHFYELDEKYLDPIRQALVSNRFLACMISRRLKLTDKTRKRMTAPRLVLHSTPAQTDKLRTWWQRYDPEGPDSQFIEELQFVRPEVQAWLEAGKTLGEAEDLVQRGKLFGEGEEGDGDEEDEEEGGETEEGGEEDSVPVAEAAAPREVEYDEMGRKMTSHRRQTLKKRQLAGVRDQADGFPRTMADMYESLIAATFIDTGFSFEKVWDVISPDFERLLPDIKATVERTKQREKRYEILQKSHKEQKRNSLNDPEFAAMLRLKKKAKRDERREKEFEKMFGPKKNVQLPVLGEAPGSDAESSMKARRLA